MNIPIGSTHLLQTTKPRHHAPIRSSDQLAPSSIDGDEQHLAPNSLALLIRSIIIIALFSNSTFGRTMASRQSATTKVQVTARTEENQV